MLAQTRPAKVPALKLCSICSICAASKTLVWFAEGVAPLNIVKKFSWKLSQLLLLTTEFPNSNCRQLAIKLGNLAAIISPLWAVAGKPLSSFVGVNPNIGTMVCSISIGCKSLGKALSTACSLEFNLLCVAMKPSRALRSSVLGSVPNSTCHTTCIKGVSTKSSIG